MANFDYTEALESILIYFIPFLFALCFHELCHGLMAKWKGDRTAEMMGRLSMNPLVHADPMGTFFLPLMGILFHAPVFGWANPVPFNARNLKNPKADIFWIAAAGPLSNVFLALVGTVVLTFVYLFAPQALSPFADRLETAQPGLFLGLRMLFAFLQINLILALFNMIPVHPLDGAKVLQRFLPYNANRWLEEHQQMISIALFVLMLLGAFAFLAWPVALAVNSLNWLARTVALSILH